MLALLALALAADPGAPSASTVDEAAESDAPTTSAGVLEQLDEDLARWVPEVVVRSRALESDSVTPQVVEAHELALKVLLVRLDLATVRLDLLDATSVARRELASQRSRVETIAQDAVEARIAWELDRMNALLVRGERDASAAYARLAASWLETWRDRVPEPGRLDQASLVLARVAARGPADPAIVVAVTCARRCVDPAVREAASDLASELRVAARASVPLDPLADLGPGDQSGAPRGSGVAPSRPPAEAEATVPEDPDEPRFRAGLSWILPLPSGTYLGSTVQRGLSGALDLAVSPAPLACVQLRVGVDRWRSAGLDEPLDLRRVRGELGWCPTLIARRIGSATVSLRAAVGVGIARSIARTEDRERLYGLGVHGRLEVPVQIGAVQLVPEVGMSPYGRAASFRPGASRAPYGFIDRLSLGLGVQLAY